MSETAVAAPQVDEFGDPVEPEAAAPEAPTAEAPATPPEAPSEQPPWAERFQSPEEMWQAFQDVDTLRGRLANEVGTLRQQVQQPPAAQPQPQGPEVPMIGELTMEQWHAWSEEEPAEAAVYFAEVRAAQAEETLAQRFEQELAPLRQSGYQAGAKAAVDLLQQELGPETVLRHQQALGERIAEDEQFFLDQSTLHARMSDFVKAREYERLTSPQRQRTDGGQFAPGPAVPPVHTEGGSTPPPSGAAPSGVDPAIAEMDALEPERDMFGRRAPGF